jgi:hypothetical protein
MWVKVLMLRAPVVEWLACGTDTAVAFELISEPLGTVERAVLSVDKGHLEKESLALRRYLEIPVNLRHDSLRQLNAHDARARSYATGPTCAPALLGVAGPGQKLTSNPAAVAGGKGVDNFTLSYNPVKPRGGLGRRKSPSFVAKNQ